METTLLIKMLRQKADMVEKRMPYDYSPSSTIEMLRETADKLEELEGECKTLGYAVLKAAKLLTKRNETIKDLEKIAAFYHKELEKKCEESAPKRDKCDGLKPCPICGASVAITYMKHSLPYNDGYNQDVFAKIECNCGLTFESKWTRHRAKDGSINMNPTITDLWNNMRVGK